MGEQPVQSKQPLKDAVDANSGRFEYFKQALTLGLAGLAGMAALFTDSTRVPTGGLALSFSVGAGTCLLIIVAWSAFALGTYANLLQCIALKEGLIPKIKSKAETKEPEYFAAGINLQAQVVTAALIAAGVCLVGFAAVRIFAPSTTEVEAAIAMGREMVARQTGQRAQAPELQRLELKGGAFELVFSDGRERLIVSVSSDGRKVTAFSRQPGP